MRGFYLAYKKWQAVPAELSWTHIVSLLYVEDKPEKHEYSERQVEQKIINNMQSFLLELGKGFSFVARQFRITLTQRPNGRPNPSPNLK